MGKSAASERLNFFIIVIYDLLVVFSSPPMGNSHIDHLIDITHVEKYAIKLANNLNFCAIRLAVKHRKGRSKL